ncbi:MAG: hypothetical protein WBA10_21775 [Elainellaceae cyanobacterium]
MKLAHREDLLTEEKLARQLESVRARSLLWGMLWGAAATTALGLVVLRPIRVVVGDQYPPLPIEDGSLSQSPAVLRDSETAVLDRLDVVRPDIAGSGGDQMLTQPVSDASLDPSASGTASSASATPPVDKPAGTLRVSNQTVHTIRIALLPQSSLASKASSQPSDAATDGIFDEPVHWDFAPSEGSTNGLLLSLPDGRQTIQSGDVLVAFSQDGSQRYWGPYIVGTTSLPAWQPGTSEWQLTIQTPTDTALSAGFPQQLPQSLP